MPNTPSTWTAEDFERWIAQLAATGWTPTSPQTVERIRAELRRGATLTIPTLTA